MKPSRTVLFWVVLIGLVAALFVAPMPASSTNTPVYLPLVLRPALPVDQIAFIGQDTSTYPMHYDLYVVDIDGAHQKNLSLEPAGTYLGGFAWSPDGSQLAFASNRSGTSHIYQVNKDGSGLVDLTQDTGWYSEPNWSVDGANIVITAQRSDDSYNQVYRMKADGSGLTRLTTFSSSSSYPFWSPDGMHIAFMVSHKIYVMLANGSSQKPITSDDYVNIPLQWSPDSSKILYDRRRVSPYEDNLWVMDANGNNSKSFTTSGYFSVASWSKDGSKIAYSDDAKTYTIDPNGSGKTEIKCSGNSIYASSLDWSPDGAYLSFTLASGSSTTLGVYTTDLSGAACPMITSSNLMASSVRWKPVK